MPQSDVFNVDCMKFMRQVPDNYYSLAIVDPPYGIGMEKGVCKASHEMFKDKKYGWDSAPPSKEYFDELMRISKNQIIWGGNYFLEHIGNTRGFIIWDKLNPDRLFADCEFAWTSFDVVARIFKPKRVQELNRIDDGKIHPTQKPTLLYRWLLENYAKVGDNILDTHLGSGSIRIAAHMMGFDFTGLEIDEDYFNAQQKRFETYHEELGMFRPKETVFNLE